MTRFFGWGDPVLLPLLLQDPGHGFLHLGFHQFHARIPHGGFIRETFKEFRLPLQDPKDMLVHRILRQQPEHFHRSGLAHTIDSGDGLRLDGRFPLGFTKHHHACRLDIQADTSCHDLTEEHTSIRSFRKPVHQFLTTVSWYAAADGTIDPVPQQLLYSPDGIQEEREYDDLPAFGLRLVCDLQQPGSLDRVSQLLRIPGYPSYLTEVPFQKSFPVDRKLLRTQTAPFFLFDLLGKLLKDILPGPSQIHRRHLLTEFRSHGQFLHSPDLIGLLRI